MARARFFLETQCGTLVHQFGFWQAEVKDVQSFGQAGFWLCANWRRHRHLSAEFSNIPAKDDMAIGG
jgi:hypothetical protein